MCLIWCEAVVSVTSFAIAGRKLHFRGEVLKYHSLIVLQY